MAPPRTRCDSANARAQASDFLTVNEKPAAVGYRAIENGDYVVRRAAALSWAHAGTRVSLPPDSTEEIRQRGAMAMRLTPPTKNVFYISVICAVVAFVLYLIGVFGIIDGGFESVSHFAFWAAMLGWGMLTAGVAMKGV
jgi:hypothetical protein